MKSLKFEIIINQAIKKANKLRHEFLSLEAILYSLLQDEMVTGILEELGASVEDISHDLDKFLRDESNFSILSAHEVEELGKNQFLDERLRQLANESGVFYQPEISMSLQRVIQRAALHVQSAGKEHIMGINILVAMFGEEDSYALYILKRQGIERLDIINQIAHGIDKPLTDEESSVVRSISHENNDNQSSLDKFAVNLNKLAKDQKIDPLIGREDEINRIVQVLCRRRKNNPLLVGDAGVGKTAIAEGLAYCIEFGKVPEILNDTTIFSLDMGLLIAGAKFRGDFEQRLKGVINELQKLNDIGKKSILFIDELHTVMGAGQAGSGSLDASNLLKPALSSGRLRCIGSTTHEEYRKFIEKDSAFGRRFQKIDIDEPTVDEAIEILKGLKSRFEDHHQVSFPLATLKSAVSLSYKYLTDRKLPDKAIDVIDEAGAANMLLPRSKRKTKITVKDIEKTISLIAKIPQANLSQDEKSKLQDLERNLKLLIFGQDKAIEKVVDGVLLSRSGLSQGDGPMSTFLFVGPTGVGKTELSKQLAFLLGINFERFDMSEYMEKHSVAKLIGAPPGYVGHEEGGKLTDVIKKNPHTVLLLDEIEKAHPDIYNILLQVFDHGKLTDSQGRSTDFRNTIIIMTSNVGARDMEGGQIGLSSSSSTIKFKGQKALKETFSPEFRNRLSSIIEFNELNHTQVIDIVKKFIYQTQLTLLEKKVELFITDKAVEWLAKIGFDPKMGARPLRRVVEKEINLVISRKMIIKDDMKPGKIEIDEENGELIFKYSWHE
ncbi:MAG: AAA family ATPase [Halobacteriovoraceae bacterium]|nr:AAA family ATPase [Halobacteriovoraceae bacterium]